MGRVPGPAVRQIDGRSYVDIENPGQVTNGVVTIEAPSDRTEQYQPSDSTLRPVPLPPAPLPPMPPLVVPAPATPLPASAPPAQPPQGLSRDFASAAIAELAEMREMRGAIRAMITYGLAVSNNWAQDDQGRVMTGLRQAEVAATTEDDQHALNYSKMKPGN